ncbi:MAG: 4-oxalocrotonate decarboxylase 4, partial [Ramlibacter sp.]|uniref:2-keto-4-pentenoate hydratase n=1 Tax=Ramlibacter sp. TaxID=1917967 RepID=UPI0026132CAA
MDTIEKYATLLDEAARNAQEVAQFDTGNQLTLQQAYAIQAASIARRLARGERRVGVKMGFTSRAKMVQMGLSDVIWGRLTDAMQEEEGGSVAFGRFVHPRVEPEIAFILKHPLAGNVTPAQAMAAVEAIAPALEIIDSRYQDFKFTLPEVIADNASSSGFVVGAWCDPHTDIANLGMVLALDGRPLQVGSSAA